MNQGVIRRLRFLPFSVQHYFCGCQIDILHGVERRAGAHANVILLGWNVYVQRQAHVIVRLVVRVEEQVLALELGRHRLRLKGRLGIVVVEVERRLEAIVQLEEFP